MGIYIPKMEKPETCDVCLLECCGFCMIMDKDIDDYVDDSERHPDCPLVYLNTPLTRTLDNQTKEK